VERGSAVVCKTAREKIFQGHLALRGKILNHMEVIPNKFLARQKFMIMSVAIVVVLVKTISVFVGKFAFADADSDGLHIATLICALL